MYLLLFSAVIRFVWLDKPRNTLIFDEYYYVNAARVILGVPQSSSGGKIPYPNAVPGIDPNPEHPPLAKLIVAFSIWLLGDNPYGWRLPSIIFGTLTVLFFYLIVENFNDRKLATLATLMLSLENLIFVHGRLATLDISSLAFMLLSFHLYLSGKALLSGLSLALATLCKETGLYGLLVLVGYECFKSLKREQLKRLKLGLKKSRNLEITILSYGLFLLVILFALDVFYGSFNNPLDHLSYICSYASQLTRPEGPVGIESYPWQWLLNEVQISYLKVDVNIIVDGRVLGSRTTIEFMGAMNPFIIFSTIPAMAYMLNDWRRGRSGFSSFILSWFTFTYLPYYPLAILLHRIMYIFYFLPTVPCVCAATAYTLSEGAPRSVVAGFLIAVIVGFASLFPFKQIP